MARLACRVGDSTQLVLASELKAGDIIRGVGLIRSVRHFSQAVARTQSTHIPNSRGLSKFAPKTAVARVIQGQMNQTYGEKDANVVVRLTFGGSRQFAATEQVTIYG